MKIAESITSMLNEIRNYNGSFGDPIIDCIEFDPSEVLATEEANYTVGAGIALLVNFASHIDNSTYNEALSGQPAKAIEKAINNNYCAQYPVLSNALSCALVSEAAFNQSLSKVYSEYVQ